MKSRYDRGMDMLKKVDNIHGEKVIATLNAVSPALSQLLAEVFGDIYSRPELTLQERELVTLSSLNSAGRLRSTAARPCKCGPECRYCSGKNNGGLYPFHSVYRISARAERCVYRAGRTERTKRRGIKELY